MSTTYDFGEKKEESYKTKNGWQTLPVVLHAKFKSSKDKAIELIESKKYGLEESDFWILKNAFGEGEKAKLFYTGLIISHNGCLKINDKLEDKLKFKPSSVSFVLDNGSNKVLQYINEDQGIFEFGEISPNNCKNDYLYAMVLKRLMDRVILKNSKVGFFGIYSEAESDEFKESAVSVDVKKSNGKNADPKLVKEAEKAAANGTLAFREFYKNITKEQRLSLEPEKAELKRKCDEVDALIDQAEVHNA